MLLGFEGTGPMGRLVSVTVVVVVVVDDASLATESALVVVLLLPILRIILI